MRLVSPQFCLGDALAGCQSADSPMALSAPMSPVKVEFTAFGDTFDGLKTVSDVEYYASDQAVAEAKNQFRAENYGNAGALFYKAVQLAPNDGEAWLGLAASCDRIRRFDLSDYAYRQAYRWSARQPPTTTMSATPTCCAASCSDARQNFLKAYELAPNDPTVANNLELLASSVDNIER